MIHHLDNLLRHLFISKIDQISDEAQVRFQPPDEAWRQYVANLTVNGAPVNALNVYLADVRENRKLRSNQLMRRLENGVVLEDRAPARVDCHYAITAWSPASSSAALEPTVDEHELLYKTIRVLLHQQSLVPNTVYSAALPPGFPPEIADEELPLEVLPVEGFPKIPEFWGSVEHSWKPMIYLLVTLPVFAFKSREAGIKVASSVIELGITRHPETKEISNPETKEKSVYIDGRVNQFGNPLQPVKAAAVLLVELGRTVKTDEEGKFHFSSLVPGNYSLQVSKDRFVTTTREVTVALEALNNFDFELTPLED